MMQTRSRRELDAEIRKISRFMERLLFAAILLYPLALAVYAFGSQRLVLSHPWIVGSGLRNGVLSPSLSAALFAALALATAPLLWGLWRLSKMFAAFSSGEVFSVTAGREFERFAWALAGAALAEPLAIALFGVLLQVAGFPVAPSVTVSVSSSNVVEFLLGLALAVVAKVMHMAARVAQENAEYV